MRALAFLIAALCGAALTIGSVLSSIEREGHQRLLQSARIQSIATEIMIQFRWMVQSWKNVLLRGHNPEDRKGYWSELVSYHERSLRSAADLRLLTEGEYRQMIDAYIINQQDLLRAYSEALQIALDSPEYNYRAADRRVRGFDRSVLVPLENLVAVARQREASEYEQHFARIRRIQWTALVFFLALLIGLGIIFSVSVKRQAAKEESLELQNAQLQILGRLSANIIHEIKNPMTVIEGRTQMIEDFVARKNSPELAVIQDHLKSIFRMNQRILTLIQAITRHSYSSENTPKAPIDCRAVLGEVELIVRSRFSEYGIDLMISPHDVQGKIRGRDIEISQVLVNLLLNAADAVRHAPQRWVRVDTLEKPGFIEFQVHDSGPGLPREVLKKLARGAFTTKEPGQGTGQGLTITRKIIAEHEGYFACDDSLPHTCFIVGLPRATTQRI